MERIQLRNHGRTLFSGALVHAKTPHVFGDFRWLGLMDHLCTGLAGSVPVVMTMEISPQHHTTVLGKGNINLKIIMQRTNTTIIFPDAGDPNIPPIKKGSVTISGAIHNVYLARYSVLIA